MKIVFLTKRHYMQKDVISDRFARLYELPNQFACQGHGVKGICLSYRPRDQGCFKHYQQDSGFLEWYSFNLGALIPPGFWHYLRSTEDLLRDFKPDLLLGSSDCLHAVLTWHFAKKFKIPYYLDLYDNYESFGLSKTPGLIPLYRRAIKNATGISCVSEPLSVYIRQKYHHKNVITLESTIIGNDFKPQDKKISRARFNLPSHAKIIGVAGSLDYNRGINYLYESYLQLTEHDSNLHLALAGSVDKKCPIPEHPRVHYLGLLPHSDIPTFNNTLDLAILNMRDTDFGRYAFPQKTYEIIACKTPILAANVGALKQLLKNYPQCLYAPDDLFDLKHKIAQLLQNPVIVNIAIPTWSEQAQIMSKWIQK